MYERETVARLKRRLEEPRRFLQVVMGPRQVGKTTLVKQVLAKLDIPRLVVAADAVPASRTTWIGDVWEQARTMLRAGRHAEFLLVIDEVQKIEGWSEAVKKEWDADSFADVPLKVVLLGSSRVMLQRGLSDAMTGRFEEFRVTHWSVGEMHDAFGWSDERYLYFGGYPGSAPLVEDPERWVAYAGAAIVDATLNKDILQGASIGKPALLRQTFELGAAYSGKILALNKMLGSLQDAGNTTTLSGYLSLLEGAGLLSGLRKYAADQARRRAAPPKFQVHDNALRSLFSEATPEETFSRPEERGRCVESAVGAYLASRAFTDGYELFYWREGALEVDFLLRKGEKLVAIEVKTNREADTPGLAAVRERFRPHGTLLVGPAGMPVGEFLRLPPLDLFR